jgi:hypothetical protein
MEVKLYRQGDVLLRKINAMPEFASWGKPKPVAGGIVAEGEATGHHHRMVGDAEVVTGTTEFRRGNGSSFGSGMFVTVAGPAQLVHEEHAALDLEAGVYEVVRQREYAPGRERRVYD